MHIVIVNFHLKGVTPSEYYSLCDQLAPAFAEVPGLVSKVWLDGPDTNTFGGVYTFESADAGRRFLESDLAAQVVSHPNLEGVAATDFGVIEGPTQITRGLIAAIA